MRARARVRSRKTLCAQRATHSKRGCEGRMRLRGPVWRGGGARVRARVRTGHHGVEERDVERQQLQHRQPLPPARPGPPAI